MRTEAYETDNISVRIKPYQQEITFDMTFHVTRIISSQWMRTVLFRDLFFLTKQL